jgi:hypothetical protein
VVAFKRITDEDVLDAIVELAGDGHCRVADVLSTSPWPARDGGCCAPRR